MRRRALLWFAGVALVVGALLLTDWLIWRPGLTAGNVRRIRPGMMYAQKRLRRDETLPCCVTSGAGFAFSVLCSWGHAG
jgi:hypothetical protein